MAISNKVKFWAGMAVSLGLMVFLFSRIDFHKLWQVMRGVDPFWLALATALNIGFFVIRAARWRFFMEPVKRDVGMWPLFSATMIGFMANNVLPARLGEFVRAYALGRREKVPTSSVFATVVVERLFDGLSVILLLIIVLSNIPQTPAFAGMAGTMRVAGEVSLAAYLLIMLALFFFIYRPEALPKAAGRAAGLFSHNLADKASALARKFITGLAVIRRPRLLAPIIIYSALHWGLLFIPILLIFKAFGLHYGVYEAIFFIVAMSFAVAL
ncbi:MAG TPA: lysylphosphatidylglycerol synthase transmembrane domain-containing protein, partial [Nitrospirota bacterium]